jgi:hypothetical protein
MFHKSHNYNAPQKHYILVSKNCPQERQRGRKKKILPPTPSVETQRAASPNRRKQIFNEIRSVNKNTHGHAPRAPLIKPPKKG